MIMMAVLIIDTADSWLQIVRVEVGVGVEVGAMYQNRVSARGGGIYLRAKRARL